MTYKGYTARIEFDPRDNIFVGRVLGVKAIIGFHGETVAQLHADFKAAIDLMIEDCKSRGCAGVIIAIILSGGHAAWRRPAATASTIVSFALRCIARARTYFFLLSAATTAGCDHSFSNFLQANIIATAKCTRDAVA